MGLEVILGPQVVRPVGDGLVSLGIDDGHSRHRDLLAQHPAVSGSHSGDEHIGVFGRVPGRRSAVIHGGEKLIVDLLRPFGRPTRGRRSCCGLGLQVGHLDHGLNSRRRLI